MMTEGQASVTPCQMGYHGRWVAKEMGAKELVVTCTFCSYSKLRSPKAFMKVHCFQLSMYACSHLLLQASPIPFHNTNSRQH